MIILILNNFTLIFNIFRKVIIMENLINKEENSQLNKEFDNLADLSKQATLNLCEYFVDFEYSINYGYINVMQLTHFTRSLDFNNLSQIHAAIHYLSFCQDCIEEHKDDEDLSDDDKENQINLNDDLLKFIDKLKEIAKKQFNHNLQNIPEHLHKILQKLYNCYYVNGKINYLHIYLNVLNFEQKEILFSALQNDLLLKINIYELLPVLVEMGAYQILENEINEKKQNPKLLE